MARTTVPADTYPVMRVLAQNTGATQFASVPQDYTLAELQACVTHRELSGTVDLVCRTCGESVADCVELRDLLNGVPASWSWESKVGEGF